MNTEAAEHEKAMLPLPGDIMRLISRPVPVVAHPAWRSARDKALALLQAQVRFIVILGAAGSGKTTLLRELAETLQRFRPVTYFSEFSELSRDYPPDSIVLVDEAERLSSTCFDVLEHKTGTTIILTALPSFYDRLQVFPEGEVVPLLLLANDEAMMFLAECIAEFGFPTNCLTQEARARLIAHTRGVPRLLVSLLKLALFVASEKSASRVLYEHVEEAIAIQGGSAVTSSVELAGLSPNDASHAGLDEAPADRRSHPEIPSAHPARNADEASSPHPIYHSFVDDAVDGERNRAHRRPIAGWVAAGALCLSAIALMLLLTRDRLRNDMPLMAQDTPGEASVSPVADGRLPLGESILTRRVGSPAAPATSQRVSASASTDTAEAEAKQAAGPAAESAKAVPQPSPGAVTATADAPPSQANDTSSISSSAAKAVRAGNTSGSGETSAANGPVPVIASPAAASVPAEASIRIAVTYARGDRAAAQRSSELSQTLRAYGFKVSDPFPVAPRRWTRGIRYYFTQDEGTAKALSDRLGGGYGAATLARFSGRNRWRRQGTIEIGVGHD